MVRIGGRGNEIEVLVKGTRAVILSVGGDGTETRNTGSLKGTQHGVFQETGTDAFALP